MKKTNPAGTERRGSEISIILSQTVESVNIFFGKRRCQVVVGFLIIVGVGVPYVA